ncbi:hypothetical protein EYY60_07050 [Flavobacterium zhairuonense]|uniref:hypothetical protein n=1 Tax=Flavobacterium zhairuonense TaxID=2493631 RepID=UPI001046F41D|nr:hypothetical protein [Flavobacterium zhairuonense]KAF2511997.1 hypothetical protein EYY60_07050 [Flavobacterium zhairuonense]
MTEISGEEFKKRLESKEKHFIDLIVNIEEKIILKTQSLNIALTFKNIIFQGELLVFHDRDSEAPFNRFSIFDNCTFLSDITFTSSTFKYLKFISCKINNQFFQIINCKIKDLSFEENYENITSIIPTIVESAHLKINGGFIKNINIENINFNYGSLSISNLNQTESFSIVRSTLNNVIFTQCAFNNYFSYIRNNVSSKPNQLFFNHCSFSISSFFETKLNDNTHFNHCTFNNAISFQDINNQINGDFKFTICDFHKFSDFDKLKIHKLRFEKTKFHDFVSFQDTYFDIIEIDKTNFEKGAFFDDIQIKKINDCDRRTIRTIKQQLQKAENKIDYSRFRVYEFNAYREDIKKKLKEFKQDKDHLNHRVREPIQLKRDAFILWISDIVSEYGTDWKRALKFTLYSGLILYFLFFVLENYEYKIALFDWENFTRFTSGLFRFFVVTDFFNPLENNRTYLTNPVSWLIFIFGKIVIAFGIYEMIQAFRKFKA